MFIAVIFSRSLIKVISCVTTFVTFNIVFEVNGYRSEMRQPKKYFFGYQVIGQELGNNPITKAQAIGRNMPPTIVPPNVNADREKRPQRTAEKRQAQILSAKIGPIWAIQYAS